MGRVYLAEDPVLNREVALKFLGGEDPVFLARFFQEARAQARVAHEHVGKVYEVGEVQGKPYIAMQYIEGKTLREAASEMTLDQKILVMQQVAEAVHAAHREGLIHRDIKPSNIMLEKTESGSWKPYVLDFGLVKEQNATGMTVTGMLIGTPAYMSPEQARGELGSLDRRSDVYSLGATLHEILAGAPVFDGSHLEILQKLLETDPEPLRRRNSRIPRDLETIVLKCLEKEPQRRYDSARALSEDLGRYLNGEPIAARRAGPLFRLLAKARKNKWTSAAILVSILALCSFLALTLRARYVARERERLAHRLGQEVTDIEAVMERAYLLPMHNITYARKQVHEKISWIEARMKDLSSDLKGPGHYALGRGYLILHENRKARENLEISWNEYGYREPEVAYSLGLALVDLFTEEMSEAERISNTRERDARKLKLDHDLRLPALEYMRRGKNAPGHQAEYGEALVAFLEQDYDRAILKAQSASRNEPSLYVAERLVGDALVAMANRNRDEGKNDEAAALYAKAETTYRSAIRKGESDGSGYEALCGLQTDIMKMEAYQMSRSPHEQYQKAIQACDSALITDPQSANALVLKSGAGLLLAEYQKNHDEDPLPALQQAADSSQKAVSIVPEEYRAYRSQGTAFWGMAENQARRGQDPMLLLQKSIDSLQKAVALYPGASLPHSTLATVYMYLGDYEMGRGQDPRPSLQKAIASSRKAIEIAPDHAAYLNLGGVFWSQGGYESKIGLDPRKSLHDAVESYNQVIRINPQYILVYSNLGGVFLEMADYEMKHGLDPGNSFSKAVAAHGESIRRSPDYGIAHANLGYTYYVKGAYELHQGIAPEPSLEAARKSLGDALRLISNLSPIWLFQGGVEIVQGRWNIVQGKSPDAAFQKASTSLLQALRLNPQYPGAYLRLAELKWWEGEWLLKQGRRPSGKIHEGLAMAQKALELDSQRGEGKALLAALYLLQARSEPARRAEMQSLAATALDEAFHMDPGLRFNYGALAEQK